MNKKIKTILFILAVSFLCVPSVNAATNPYNQYSQYGTNCVWYVWNQVYNKKGIALPGWGNAKDWYNDAKKSGYETGTTPRVGSIVVWDLTSLGHVGYVESVEENVIYVWDTAKRCIDMQSQEYIDCYDNLGGDQKAEEQCRAQMPAIACKYSINPNYKEGGVDYHTLIGYIYLDNVPKTPVNNSNSETNSGNNSGNNSTNQKPATEVKKSSNNNLSVLNIGDLDFKFDKDLLEYSFEVENEIEEIVIDAKVEDKKAKIDGTGNVPLKVGNNNFIIKVTAEDSSTKEYKISITRKEEEKEEVEKEEKIEENIKEDTETSKSKKTNYIFIIVGVVFTIVVISSGIVIYNKKKNRKK